MDDLRGGSSDTARGLRQRGARGRGAELETLAKEPGRHRPRLSVAALGWIAVPTLLLLGIVGAPSAAWLGLAAGLAVLGVLAVVQRRRVARAAPRKNGLSNMDTVSANRLGGTVTNSALVRPGPGW